MGGYGVLVSLGAGLSPSALARARGLGTDLQAQLLRNAHANPRPDPRVRAAVAIAPWGGEAGLWRPEALARVTAPTLFVAGSADTVSGYARGVRRLFEEAVRSDRYLLTFLHAGHNAGAPIPLPCELAAAAPDVTGHYLDPVWDTVRMNNILDHFATAFLDAHLQGAARAYLSASCPGFAEGGAAGLRLEHRAPRARL